MTFIGKIREKIKTDGLLAPGDGVLVALSGGADSVALLLALNELSSFSLAAAHLNHGIRGEEADRDEAFCRELCKNLGIKFFSAHTDVPSVAKKNRISLETAARDERYGFLSETARGLGCCIATAHNANDNLETLLFNMGRGTSIRGLCGIPVARLDSAGVKIIRPLLCVSRREIEEYLSEKGQSYCTDSTNLADDATRNRLRHFVVPQFLNTFPEGLTAVSRMTGLIADDEAYLSKQAEELVKRYRQEGVAAFEAAHISILSRSVRMICEKLCGRGLEEVHIRALCDMVASGRGECALPGGRVVIRRNRLVLARDAAQAPVPVSLKEGIYPLWDGWYAEVCSEYTQIYRGVHKNATYTAESRDILLCNDAVFRTRQAGDSVFLPKRRVTKPLKKLLNELKVPVDERDRMPVLAVGSRVVLLPIEEFNTAFPAGEG